MEEELRLMAEADALADNALADKTSLEALGNAALKLEDEIEALESTTKDRKEALLKLLRHDIPDALRAAGASEYGWITEDGRNPRMKVGAKVTGTLANAPDEEAAVAYLEANGFEGGVLTFVSVGLTESQRETAGILSARIKTEFGLDPEIKRKVSPAVLAAFGRAHAADDPPFDMAKVGLESWIQASFTKRK